MNDKQIIRRYAMQKRYGALVLLCLSVTAGLFGALLFPDLGWAAALPGTAICLLAGWAAFVLLSSASRVVEGQKADEIDALFADPPDTERLSAVTRTEVEENSGTVILATALAAVAALSVMLLGLTANNGVNDRKDTVHQANRQDRVKHEKLQGFELSEPEQHIMLDVIIRKGKVFTDKERKNILAIDFSSSQKVDDVVLEEYSRGLPALLELDLRSTPVTDSGARHLTTLQTLRRLRLGGTHVSPEEIAALRLALPECLIDTEMAE
jgi:hypothetical protein